MKFNRLVLETDRLADRRSQFVKSVDRLGETIEAIDARLKVMEDWHAAERTVAAELNKLNRLQ